MIAAASNPNYLPILQEAERQLAVCWAKIASDSKAVERLFLEETRGLHPPE